ncbi:response regulator [Chitinophaga sp. Cy-1792]|uniref:response regulator n=1 Tax=Chitinophaga sp. Cy-1792 TaxID=2608339 RepID=UPI00141E0140|nr:response regulator [Chitinophaga sp. Cy-1792]NIG56842.1 response regulator [Chitinophaga sp. Cy-1792]
MTEKFRFLLVDDDDDDAFLFGEVLQQIAPDTSFESISNGQEALDRLKNGTIDIPDIIFLDLNMPRMDGRECLIELKKDEQLKKIPVIIYTTSSLHSDIQQTLENGALSFVTKPTNIKALEEILHNVFRNIQ